MLKKEMRIVSIMVAIFLTMGIFMAGCGSSSSNSTTTTQAADTEAAEEPVTIHYYTWRTEDTEVFNKLIDKFQTENPGIKVQLDIQIDPNIMSQTIQASITTGENLDVFDEQPAKEYLMYAQKGYLADQSDLPYMSTYMEKVKNLTAVNGKNYGYCAGINVSAFFYNKDIFNECGVTVPTTWDEFTAAMKKLKDKGYGGISYIGAVVGSSWLSQYFIGVELGPEALYQINKGFDSGELTSIKDNQGVINGLKACQLMVKDKYIYDNAISIQFDQGYSLFAQKKAPIMLMGTWAIGEAPLKFPDINFGIMGIPTPTKADTTYVMPIPAMVTCVAANSKHLEEAKKFVNFLATPENSNIYLNASKFMPTVTGIIPDYLKDQDFMKSVIQNGVVLPPIDNFLNGTMWQGTWTTMCDNIIWNGADINKEVDKFDAALQKVDIKTNGKKN